MAVGWGCGEEHWQRIEDFFQRHGGKTVFLARFSAFFRILVPFFAGAVRLSYFHFLLFNVLGGVLWAAGSVLIGYLGRRELARDRALDRPDRAARGGPDRRVDRAGEARAAEKLS